MPTEIDSLQIKIEAQSSKAAHSIDELVASLSNLKSVPAVKSLGNSLKKLSASLEAFNMSSEGAKKLSDLANALKPLQNLKMPNLNSLKKLPEITKALDDTAITAFGTACQKLATVLEPLAIQAQRIGSVFASLPAITKRTISAMYSYTKSASTASPATERLAGSLIGLRAKFAVITLVAQKAFSVIGGWVDNINSYVENVNLFTVAMGKYADEAMEYAETVHDAMGIDVSEFIRNQGIFMSMATGFGLAEEAAYNMSKGLTELSYDLASFYNISLDAVGDGAFSKVQSGLAGELEPLRRLGFALSEASLQQVAYSHGINLSVREMTEAQKATLRYTAMVEQAADMGAIGDMSRTLMTPANAIRILKQQLNELTRSLGSLFIPILIKVIPYVQAFVKVLTQAAQAIAAIVGFTLPTIDYSGVKGLETSTENVTDGLDDATESAKALKSQMMGIDELNVVSQDTGSSSTTSTGNGYASDLGLDVESIWDESIFKNIESQVDDLMPKMKGLAVAIGAVATAWAGIKVGTWITTVAGFLGNTAFVQNLGAFVSLLAEGCGLVPTLEAAFPTLTTSLTALGAGSLGAGLAVVAVALVAIGSAIYYVVENIDQVKRVAKEFFDLEIAPKIDSIKESFRKVGETLKPIADLFSPVITAVKTFVTETLGIKSIGDIFEFLGGVVFNKFASGVAGVFNAMITCVTGFASIISGVVTTVSGVIHAVVAIFTGDLPGAKKAVDEIFGGIVSVFTGLYNVTVGPLVEYVKGVCGWFTTLMTNLVGEDSIIPKTINSIVSWFASLPTKILGGLGTFCSNVVKKFIDMWGDIKDWFTKNVKPKIEKLYIVKLLSGMVAGVKNSLTLVKKALSDKWDSIKSWWTTSVAPKFTKEYWSGIFAAIKDGFIDGIKTALNKGIDMLNNFVGWVNSKMSFTIPGFSIAGKELWGDTPVTLMTLPKITQRFADGGFIEDGLFTMNQGEIAGKFNNGKSVVANNEQIIAGISEGVYSAVMAAMSNGGNRESQSVNVYLDGKQIYSSFKKTESERGKQIFGNQLGYGY